jgi:hypothetical protein
MLDASQAHQLPVELLKRHAKSMAKLRGDGQSRIGFATLDLPNLFPADATLTSQPILAQPAALP